MTDFAATFRWANENQTWLDSDAAEDNDRALEQWLGAGPQPYAPTFLHSDGSVPTYIVGGSGTWERQRGQFIICTFTAITTAVVAATGKFLGVSIPTRPALVTPAAGGAWSYPAAGCVTYSEGDHIHETSRVAIAPFPAVSGSTYFAEISGDGSTAVGARMCGLVMYREEI